MKKTISEMTADNRLLIQLFADAELDQLITHRQMNQHIGRDSEENIMNRTIETALRRDHDRVIESVRGEGYKVLKPTDVANGYADARRARIHRAANKTMRALATVSREALPDEAKLQYDTKCSLIGVLAHVTSKKAQKAVESAAQTKQLSGQDALLATAETLEALKHKK